MSTLNFLGHGTSSLRSLRALDPQWVLWTSVMIIRNLKKSGPFSLLKSWQLVQPPYIFKFHFINHLYLVWICVTAQWYNQKPIAVVLHEGHGVSNHRKPSICSTVCSGAHQRKYQNQCYWPFVRGIHRWPVDSPHKEPVTRKLWTWEVIEDKTNFEL